MKTLALKKLLAIGTAGFVLGGIAFSGIKLTNLQGLQKVEKTVTTLVQDKSKLSDTIGSLEKALENLNQEANSSLGVEKTENSGLHNKIDELNKKVSTLQKTASTLESSNAAYQQQIQNQQNQISSKVGEVNSKQEELNELSGQVSGLTKEIENLRQQLSAKSISGQQLADTVDTVNQKVTEYQTKADQLNEQIASLTKENNTLKNNVSGLIKDRDNWATEYYKTKDALNAKIEEYNKYIEYVGQLEEKVSNLQKQDIKNQEQIKELEKVQAELTGTKIRVEAIEQQKDELKAVFASLSNEYTKYKIQAEQEKSQAAKDKTAIQSEVNRLEGEIEKANAAIKETVDTVEKYIQSSKNVDVNQLQKDAQNIINKFGTLKTN